MRHDTDQNPSPADHAGEDEHASPAGEIRLSPKQIGMRVAALTGVALGGFIAMSPATISSMK
jgi:hypothetical protein